MNLLAQAPATFVGPEVDWWALVPLLILGGGGLVMLVVAPSHRAGRAGATPRSRSRSVPGPSSSASSSGSR